MIFLSDPNVCKTALDVCGLCQLSNGKERPFEFAWVNSILHL